MVVKREEPNTLEYDGFVATFYIDVKSRPPVHHYIVTRKGDSEIVSMGRSESLPTAKQEALRIMKVLDKSA